MPVLLPLFLFPPIEYFCWLLNSNAVCFEINETYLKQTYRNRYYIFTSQGVMFLTLPVVKTKGNKSKITEIELDDKVNWRINHLRTIKTAYGKSPYFIHYFDIINEIINFNTKSLIEFNLNAIKKLLNTFKIDINICFTCSYINNYDNNYVDLRNYFSKYNINNVNFDSYIQTFSDKFEFQSNLSIVDLIFNEGPLSCYYIENQLKR